LGGLSIYGALELGNVDPLPLARAIHLDSLIDLNKIDPAHGNVAVAIILNEVAELVRLPSVLPTVPKVSEEGGRDGRRRDGRREDYAGLVPLMRFTSSITHPSLSLSLLPILSRSLLGGTHTSPLTSILSLGQTALPLLPGLIS